MFSYDCVEVKVTLRAYVPASRYRVPENP